MNVGTTTHRLFASALALLWVSCASTHQLTSPNEGEIADFVLIIGEEPDGQVTHSWQRATEFDLSPYAPDFSRTASRPGAIVFAAHRPRDCDQEQIDCVRNCMRRRLPSSESHISIKNGNKYGFCQEACLKEYLRCLDAEKGRALQFSAGNEAVKWLKQNRKELLVGTLVVIAGVTFVTLSAGAGVVILAPVVLVAA
ncbi:hypothetical protein ACN28E_01905 [Archangium lansingense]|uniref:hypothetical protein n=1 Tax=Archangium lansingense TaxID=2995310 RepID=UPI003B787901